MHYSSTLPAGIREMSCHPLPTLFIRLTTASAALWTHLKSTPPSEPKCIFSIKEHQLWNLDLTILSSNFAVQMSHLKGILKTDCLYFEYILVFTCTSKQFLLITKASLGFYTVAFGVIFLKDHFT